jgi:hypothetical protein
MSEEDAIIYVADFTPGTDGSLNHWVLWICTDLAAGEGISINVEGFTRNWERRISSRNHPAGSSQSHAMVEVGAIELWKVNKLVKWIEQNILINNSSDNWNCQFYITTILRKLQEEGICDEGVTGCFHELLRRAAS